MRAFTVLAGTADSGAVVELPEPDPADGRVLVQTLAVGVCGTDREILAGKYGQAPPGQDRLVLGHEAIGRVVEAPDGIGLRVGDLVVPIVRRPDPVPCGNCAVGEWDMCRNGLYTEHGIKALNGFARERFRTDPERLVQIDPRLDDLGVLLEPASVVAKAWEHIERIGGRAHWQPQRLLVTGAGPIGLFGALLGVQRGLDVHVVDVVSQGAKPNLVEALGATYHATPVAELGLAPDIVLEATGVGAVIGEVIGRTGRNAIVCLAGISVPGRTVGLDLGALNLEWVLDNDVVFGSVNANRRHYEQAADALAAAEPEWLSGMLTRRVSLDAYADALASGNDVKSVVTL